MSTQPLTLELPPELVDVVAERVASLIAQQPTGPEKWVGVSEAAEHLACPKSRIYELCSRKDESRLPHRRDGSRLLFKCSQLDRYLEGSR